MVWVLTHQAQGFSVGAPTAACDQMLPRHGLNIPQTSDSPFQLITDGTSVGANSERIEVTLSSPTGDKFLGFLIQARDDNDTIQGIFSSKIHKMISCNSDVNSTVTHRIPDNKSQVRVQWFPFATFRGNVTFRATVVQDFTTFWTGIISEKVTVVDSPPTTTTTTTPTTSTASTTTVEITEAPRRGLLSGVWNRTKPIQENIYCGCGVTKGCFGLPFGCEADQNCESLFTYTKVDQDYQFEIMGQVDPNTANGYVAGGLSFDNRMGSDSVVACRIHNGEVDVTMTWNDDNYFNQFHVNEKEGLYNYQMYQIDGKIYCRYNRATKMVINGITFDMDEGNFYVMLASGPLTSVGGLSYHSRRGVTEA